MSVVQLPTLAQIEEEAAVWVWRFDAGQLPAADRRDFDAWLRRDPRHKHAFEELGGVWDALDELAEAKREEKIATFTAPPPALPGARRARRARRMAFAAAASVAIAVAAGWWWLGDGAEAQMLSTAVGQQRSVKLADGSRVNLNTNTIVETLFVSDRREVRLLKGEAHFTVARDAERPFRVHAGNTVVQAVGTAFNVRVRAVSDVEVLVTHGRVKVTSQKPAAAAGTAEPDVPVERSLQAGQRLATADDTLAVAAVSTEALANALAWRDGAIVFDGLPLSRAIVELNRYAETRFVITDPLVGEMRVGGRFRTGDIEEFVRGLETALPVAARRTADGLVFIESRPRPAAGT
jgi:transmembrane sensor